MRVPSRFVQFLLLGILAVVPSTAQFQYNAIDSVYHIRDNLYRYTLDIGAHANAVLRGRSVDGGNATVVVHGGSPVYQYEVDIVGFVPVKSTAIEVENCIRQTLPDVYHEADLDHAKKKRDFLCGFVNKIPGVSLFSTSSCPNTPILEQFDKILRRDHLGQDLLEVAQEMQESVDAYARETNAILTAMNNETNYASNDLKVNVHGMLAELKTRTVEIFESATSQLNSVMGLQNDRVLQLMNMTNNELNAQDPHNNVLQEAGRTYQRMLKIVSDQMSAQWSYLKKLMESVQRVEKKDSDYDSAIKEFEATIVQLQNHQYGFGTIAGTYHQALKLAEEEHFLPFLGSRGIAPMPDDDFPMIILVTHDFADQFCGETLYVICRMNECNYYVRNIDEKAFVSDCSLGVDAAHVYAFEAVNEATFTKLQWESSPALRLKLRALLLELHSIYGRHQRSWGTTLGEGCVTDRSYSVFRDGQFYSKCDILRFGAYVNDWVPVYRLSFADSFIEGARALIQYDSGAVKEIEAHSSSLYFDPNRESLFKNKDYLIFHRAAIDGKGENGFFVYNPPIDMIKMDGPAMSRLGRLGYVSANQWPNNSAQFFSEWERLHGPVNPTGFAISLADYRAETASSEGFCGDVAHAPHGLCLLSTMYDIDFRPEERSLKLRPKVADMNVKIDLPFSSFSIQTAAECPPHADKNIRLTCNNSTCQLVLRNPSEEKMLRLSVEINHRLSGCSFSFPVNVYPRVSLLHANEIVLPINLCPGKSLVAVYPQTAGRDMLHANGSRCIVYEAIRSDLPPLEEISSSMMAAVTQETQSLIQSYQTMLDTLTRATEREKAVLVGLKRFMADTDPIELIAMGFNIADWSRVLLNKEVLVGPALNISVLESDFTLSLNLESLVMKQATLMSQMKEDLRALRELTIKQEKFILDLTSFDSFAWTTELSGYQILLIIAMAFILVGLVLCRVYCL